MYGAPEETHRTKKINKRVMRYPAKVNRVRSSTWKPQQRCFKNISSHNTGAHTPVFGAPERKLLNFDKSVYSIHELRHL